MLFTSYSIADVSKDDLISFEYILDERDYIAFIFQYRKLSPFVHLVPRVKVVGPTYKDDGTLSFTTPVNWMDWDENHKYAWTKLTERIYSVYQRLLASNLPIEEAKQILPSSLTYKMTLTGNKNEWFRVYGELCPILERLLTPAFVKLGFE